MKQPEKTIRLIITLTQHPVLGVLLTPYTAEDLPDGTIKLLEHGGHLSSPAKLTDAEQKAIKIATAYSDKSLMKVFSKETVVTAFLKKLTEENFKKAVRPFIDKKMLEMLELMRVERIPFYQNEKGNKILFAHNNIKVPHDYAESLFHFEADDDHFSYSLQCKREGKAVPLTEQKPVIVLTPSPASILLGNELLLFRNISSMRIIPFTNKNIVSVSASETDKYLEKVVLPILRFHDITFSGLRIFEEQRNCLPRLSVEENIFDATVLRLSFHYEDETFYPGSAGQRKSARIHKDTDGRMSIRYFCRDLETEKQLADILETTHLKLVNDCYYRLREDAPEKDMVQWIVANRRMLGSRFRLLSGNHEADYCLDDIRMEQEITKEPDWFELHITVVVGTFRIPFIRFRKNILTGKREYILPDGRIILLPEEWFSKYTNLLEHSEAEDEETGNMRLKHTFIGLVESAFSDARDRKKLPYQAKEHIAQPASLKAKLRNYQEEGFNWMLHLNKHRLGGCLADDMGLGKTLQTLSLLQHIYDNGQSLPASLIVMPTSLLHNWRKEIRRFTTLRVYEFTAIGWPGGTNYKSLFDRYHLILTSYGMMRNHIEALKQYRFEYVVLDESQHIKNSDSQTFKTAIMLRGNGRLTLTGTPIENSLKDLWSQFHFFQPDLLGTESAFQKEFIIPIRQGNKRVESKLQQLIAPFILRRCKEEVAPELPQLTEEIIYCEMTDGQKEEYNKEKNSLRNVLLQLNTDQEELSKITILNGINHLRQLACHPRMVDENFQGSSGKLQEIVSTFETLKSEGHKVLIFSSFVKHLDLIAEVFQTNGWPYAMLTGSSTDREEEIRRFAETDSIQAFLISLKAGGVGLNLTQADYVFIIDPWWNPAAELQAIARAHRIGQEKHVFAYRFITEGSIEEKIVVLQDEKKELFDTFITDNNPLRSLSDKEWAGLLGE